MKIAVVGAGLAGLTAAWRLQQQGHAVTVLEREPTPGGRARSETTAGFTVDIGAHMFLDSYVRTRALVEELDLADRWYELESPEEGGILHERDITSFSPRGAFDVLRYRGLSMRGRLRLFVALARARRWADLDFFDLSSGDPTLDDESCRSFSVRRMGREATDYVVDTFIRTFHFHGSHRMSRMYFEALAALLVRHGELRPCALRGHMQVLPSALADRLEVRRGTPVREITPVPGGVEITGASESARFDEVVVATPAAVARRLLVAPSAHHEAVLASSPGSCTITCAFSLPSAVVRGFEGIWVPFVESQIISGLSNETSKGSVREDHCLFTIWLHEESASAIMDWPDRQILDHVSGELVRLFPDYAGHVTGLGVWRWPLALPVYAPGQITRVRQFWNEGQGTDGIWLCGDYLNHPWVEGAVRCGEKVARLVADS